MLETMDGQSDRRYYLTPEQIKEVKKTQQAIRSGKMKFLTEKEIHILGIYHGRQSR